MREREIIYKPGDRVRFVPNHANYEYVEMRYQYCTGMVVDSSTLPNVHMDTTETPLAQMITADQRDLLPI